MGQVDVVPLHQDHFMRGNVHSGFAGIDSVTPIRLIHIVSVPAMAGARATLSEQMRATQIASNKPTALCLSNWARRGRITEVEIREELDQTARHMLECARSLCPDQKRLLVASN